MGKRLCVLHHGIQNSMEAILACHPGLSISCELWRIHTDPIAEQPDTQIYTWISTQWFMQWHIWASLMQESIYTMYRIFIMVEMCGRSSAERMVNCTALQLPGQVRETVAHFKVRACYSVVSMSHKMTSMCSLSLVPSSKRASFSCSWAFSFSSARRRELFCLTCCLRHCSRGVPSTSMTYTRAWVKTAIRNHLKKICTVESYDLLWTAHSISPSMHPQAHINGGCAHYVMVSKFNGSHFGLPPSSIHQMTGLGGKMVWTMTYAHRPHCVLENIGCIICTIKPFISRAPPPPPPPH